MTGLSEAGPPMTHIPGAGIEFASVGLVRLIEPDQIGPSLPRSALPGVRLAAPERLLSAAVVDVGVGDLLVTMTYSSGHARLGRPMQVLHAGSDGAAVVLDDRSLPHSIEVDPSLSSTLGYGEAATAWHVLAAFRIGRCPRCHVPGLHPLYGLFVGTPSAGRVAVGCVVPSVRADFLCPRCHAEWPLPAVADRFNPNGW